MDFTLTDEQQMLADLAARFVEKSYDFEDRKRFVAEPAGFSKAIWSQFAETGLLGLCLPGQFDGMGATPAETLLVMEAFGRGLVVEPYVQNAVIAPRLLSRAGTPEQQQALLPALAAGEVLTALACQEPEGRFDLARVNTRAEATANGFRLAGAKSTVVFADTADKLFVTARTAGGVADRHGISLFVIDRAAAGITATSFRTFDGRRCSELVLNNVEVPASALIGPRDGGLDALEDAIDQGIAALCAEAVGVMQRLLDLTTDYLKSRKQFGKPIGTFQALQHRAAEMVIALEQARSVAFLAAAAAQETDAATRRKGVSAAKSVIGRLGRQVGEAAVQLHGGMGMTDEMLCGHYFKRLVAIDKTFGDSDYHLDLFAATLA